MTSITYAFNRELNILVLDRQTKAKSDLKTSAAAVLATLELNRRIPADPFAPESIGSIGNINRAALIQHAYGEPERAATLCRLVLDLCANLFRTEGRWGWAFMMVNPYQNLAQLAGMRGDIEEARRVFRQVYEFFIHKKPMTMYGLVLDATHGDLEKVQKGSDDLVKAAPYTYLHGVARALLANNENAELVKFLDERQLDVSFERTLVYRCCIYELYARAHLKAGQYREADLALTELELCRPSGAVASLMRCQLQLLSGNTADAYKQALVAYESLRSLGNARFSSLYLLSLCLLLLGDIHRAHETATRALNLAKSDGDQPAMVRSLNVLLVAAQAGGRSIRAETSVLEEALLTARACLYRYDRGLAFFELGEYLEPGHKVAADGTDAAICYRHSRDVLEAVECPEDALLQETVNERVTRCAQTSSGHNGTHLTYLDETCEHLYSVLMDKGQPERWTGRGR